MAVGRIAHPFSSTRRATLETPLALKYVFDDFVSALGAKG
jgi:hypothetical protein